MDVDNYSQKILENHPMILFSNSMIIGNIRVRIPSHQECQLRCKICIINADCCRRQCPVFEMSRHVIVHLDISAQLSSEHRDI